MTTRPLPMLSPELLGTDPFWSHARERELVFQRCAVGHVVFYPRRHCTTCGTEELTLCRSGGAGTLFSFTVVHVHPDPYFVARVPYVVGLVELDEGFRMVSEIHGPEPSIGDRVRLVWDTATEIPVPVFEISSPVADASPHA